MNVIKKALVAQTVLSAMYFSSTVAANPYDPWNYEPPVGLDDQSDIGSDSIIIDESTKRALEEIEKNKDGAMSVSGAYAALEAPVSTSGKYRQQDSSESVGEFNFRISAGYGVIQNPLKLRDDIEVYVLPEFSYYGEKFYAENFVVGYSLFETEQLMFDVFGYFNEDGYFFELDGIEKITVSTILGRKPSFFPLNGPLELDDVERDLSYLAGFNTTYRGDWFDLKVSLATDVTGVHNGQEAKFKFSKSAMFGNFYTSASLTSTFKSSTINDYYYLLQENEYILRNKEDSLGSTVNYSLELHLAYKITSSISANLLVQKTWLDDALEQSILVEDLSYISGFAGLTYRF